MTNNIVFFGVKLFRDHFVLIFCYIDSMYARAILCGFLLSS